MKSEFLHAGAKAEAEDQNNDDYPFERAEKNQERDEKEREAKASAGEQQQKNAQEALNKQANEISSKSMPGGGGGGGGGTDGGGGGIHLSAKAKHILTIIGYVIAGIFGFLLLCACLGHYGQKREAAKASLKAPLMTS